MMSAGRVLWRGRPSQKCCVCASLCHSCLSYVNEDRPLSETSAHLAGESPLVLIANDQEWTARAVESILASNGYRVLRAFTARETLQLAEAVDPDLVILDHQLPDFSGVEVCRRLRADARFGAALPVIMTTAGPSGRQQRVAAYSAGAWEFYGQPLDSEALLHKLSVYYAAYRDVRRLRRDAMVDAETGLYSRIGLVRRATELLSEARRAGRAVACVRWTVPDPNDAAQVSQVARTFRVHARSADVQGRLAAGEFAIVAADTSAEGAERLASRFRRLFATAAGSAEDAVITTVVSLDDPGLLPSDGEQLLQRLAPSLAA